MVQFLDQFLLKKESKNLNLIITFQLVFYNFSYSVFEDKSPISIERVFTVILIVRKFRNCKDSWFSRVYGHFVDPFFLQKPIENPGKSWKYEKQKNTDIRTKLRKTSQKTVQKWTKSSKMDDFRVCCQHFIHGHWLS